MKSKNICRSITSIADDKLEVHNFIYETDPKVMEDEKILEYNRAILVKCGNGEFSFNGKTFAFSPGTLIFGFAGEIFKATVKNECSYMYISFSGMRADALLRRFGVYPENRVFSGFDCIIPLFMDSLSRVSDENADLAAESIMLYIFSRFSSSGKMSNSLISEIIDITDENFSDNSLSINTIANQLSYNPKYISHIFREKMGITYTLYLQNLRIKYAVMLFDHGIDSVKNVAFLSGFSDPLYFSRVFKKTMGKSPSEYMKNTSDVQKN